MPIISTHKEKMDAQGIIAFCDALEMVCVETVESGKMTKDLTLCIHGEDLQTAHYLTTEEFLTVLDENLHKKLSEKQ